MVTKLMSINVGELPKTIPHFLQKNWKAATAATVCFFVVLPVLIRVYQRWTTPAQDSSASPSTGPKPAPINTGFHRSEPAPVNPSASHSLSSLLPRPSLTDDVDAIKLGFDFLARKDVCNTILDAIRHSNQKSPIILNSAHICECLDCGLPEGQSYHTTTPDNQKLSWVYQTLQALVTGRYILSFAITENNNRAEIRIVV